MCNKKLNITSQNDYIEQEEVEDETKENINDSNSNRISKIRSKASDNISVKKKRISRKMESTDFAPEQKNNSLKRKMCDKKRVLLFPSVPFHSILVFSKVKNCYYLPFSLLFPSTFKSLKK